MPRAPAVRGFSLDTAIKYPLGAQLADIFKYSKKRGTHASERAPDTVDIVSPDLCGMFVSKRPTDSWLTTYLQR